MRCPPVNPGHEKRICDHCGKSYVWIRTKQRFCSSVCHAACLYHKPKWLVTRVTPGLNGGYAFSVSIAGAPALGGFFLSHIGGFIRFPSKLCITRARKARLSGSLGKQVGEYIRTHCMTKAHDEELTVEVPAKEPTRLEACSYCGGKAELALRERDDGSTFLGGRCKQCQQLAVKELTPATKRRGWICVKCGELCQRAPFVKGEPPKVHCNFCQQDFATDDSSRVRYQQNWEPIPPKPTRIP